MGYVEEYDLLADSTNDLHKKVARAIDKAARDITNESPGTASHEVRMAWAVLVRDTPGNNIAMAHKWIVAVLDNPTIAVAGDAALDNDVQFVVNSLVNKMAGV